MHTPAASREHISVRLHPHSVLTKPWWSPYNTEPKALVVMNELRRA